MSEAIEAILKKRRELEVRLHGLQSAIYHLDQTLELLGYNPDQPVKTGRRFANGELVAMVGEAERLGHTSQSQIVTYVMTAKGWDVEDETLRKRIAYSVKDCRKRTSAIARAARAAA
jgi:hypothetical protein